MPCLISAPPCFLGSASVGRSLRSIPQSLFSCSCILYHTSPFRSRASALCAPCCHLSCTSRSLALCFPTSSLVHPHLIAFHDSDVVRSQCRLLYDRVICRRHSFVLTDMIHSVTLYHVRECSHLVAQFTVRVQKTCTGRLFHASTSKPNKSPVPERIMDGRR